MAASSSKRRRRQERAVDTAAALLRVMPFDGEPVEIPQSSHRAACQAFANAMQDGGLEAAELWTMVDGERGTRFARYANDGV